VSRKLLRPVFEANALQYRQKKYHIGEYPSVIEYVQQHACMGRLKSEWNSGGTTAEN
jgi:hypothetical protein